MQSLPIKQIKKSYV